MNFIAALAKLPIEQLFLGVASFLLVSILLSKFAVRVGIPVLLFFLLIGMLAGSDGPGGIFFDDPHLVELIGVVALAFILFSGGLDTVWDDIQPILSQGIALSTLGVLITAFAVGACATVLLGFTWVEGILLGAIVASTDAAAVFSVLRGKSVNLKGKLKPLLELESGSNDPMGVFLTLGMLQLLLNPAMSPLELIPLFVLQMGLGALIGISVGKGALFLLNRLRLEYEGLYPVLTISLVFFTFGFSDLVGGNGFLAVYLVGVVMGRERFVHKHSLTQFHDGLAWLVQITMFFILGLQVYPSRLPTIAGSGLAIAAFLILVARPASVFIGLHFTTMTTREKLFISWVGLRGAVPIVMAIFPLLAGVDKADTIFNLVFFIVLASVLIQGTLTVPMARWLDVYDATPTPKSPLAFVMEDNAITSDLTEITVTNDAPAVGRQILNLQLPKEALIMLIGRNDDLLVPRGDTVIQVGDKVLLIVSGDKQHAVRRLFGETSE